jgi:hypothetical protein
MACIEQILYNRKSNMKPASLSPANALSLTAGLATPDDGQHQVTGVSSPPGIEDDPEPESEHAFIEIMNFHVPAQRANRTLEAVKHYNIDDVLVKAEEKARSLINVFVYGPVIGFDDFFQSGFPGHDRHVTNRTAARTQAPPPHVHLNEHKSATSLLQLKDLLLHS